MEPGDNTPCHRVLVCGGRDFRPGPSDYATLASFIAPGMILIHGGARGADAFAAGFAKGLGSVQVIEFQADWKRDGKAAGPLRNERMLRFGKPDLVLAFPGGRGTADMVRRARAAGVEVVEVSRGA